MRVIFLRKQFSLFEDYDRETLMQELSWFASAIKTLHSKVGEALANLEGTDKKPPGETVKEPLGKIIGESLKETFRELLNQIISDFTYENLKKNPAGLSESAESIAKNLDEQLTELEKLTDELINRTDERDWEADLERIKRLEKFTDLINEIIGIVKAFKNWEDTLSKIQAKLSRQEIEKIVDEIASETE